MNPIIKKISNQIKFHKKEIERLESTRDTIMAFERGAKKKRKARKKVK